MSLSHFDESGAARMVDVGQKPVTQRMARASGCVSMNRATWDLIAAGTHKKGDVLGVARLAGIMAAKQTSTLIPLCHQLPLDSVKIDFEPPSNPATNEGQVSLKIIAAVKVTAQTGVEMEALTAVSVAALTIYDMCKAVDRSMLIEHICLEEKSGGQSGHFKRENL